MTNSQVKCPQCGSTRLWKDGLRYNKAHPIQRYLCRECGYRFSEASARKNLNKDFQDKRPFNKALQEQNYTNVLLERKLMTGLELQSEKWAAGATEKPSEAELQGKIIEFLWWMKKQGYKESTIVSRGTRLRRLVRLGADLFDPESVKNVIASQDGWSEARKEAMVYAYDLFARWAGIKWERPRYEPARKLPFIPIEREIDDLIASCNKHVATFLQVAKETGARAGEIFALKWADVDLETRTLRVTAEKGSDARIFKISSKLSEMLRGIPKEGEKVFCHYKTLQNLRRSFERYRARVAHKLGNPRLLQITFHTLRHWKGTMEYYKTKDILYVMKVLGHRNIKNTLLYTQLVKFREGDEFICKVARTPDEISQLIEAGFEFVLEKDGLAYFRKRK